MPDLYAINLHLQQRLELDWREEVRAVEAARWLDKADLLRNHKNGLPLRRLLRAGRIAGQAQRPNRKNGAWFIRRIAASRDPNAIREAREQLRCCLPIDRANFPADWPVNQGPAVFWQELGKTIAAFGYLERTLASTCYALLATPENARVFLDEHDEEATTRWVKRIVQSQVDPMHGLTSEFDRVLREAGRVPHTVREDLVSELRELRPWRNALCHGAWLSVDEAGSGHLEHLYLEDGVPVAFEPKLALQDLSDVRARTVDVTFRIAEAASIASAGLPLAAMPRKYVPRNGPPEPE